MKEAVSNNKRIAKNTIILYFRMLLLMIVGLYTSRIIFQALGVVDYGLNNIVNGLVIVFTYVNGALSLATSRYITFELGRNNIKGLREVFATAFLVHVFLAIIVFILLEFVGVWFLNTHLVIPGDRLFACNIIFQISIVLSVLSIIQVPFSSLIISHEKMNVYAYIGIINAMANLLIALFVAHTKYDKLILLSALDGILGLSMMLFYNYYSRKQFNKIVNYTLHTDKQLVKSILNYSIWGLFGSSAMMMRNQGINILINLFFGSVVNAANAIAYSVNSSISAFVNNFTTAINPQIIKTYSAGQFTKMVELIEMGGRFSYLLLLCLCLPIFIETNYILTLWLGDIPEYTVNFTRFILVITLAESFNFTISAAIQATGHWRNYQLVISGLNLLNFPIAFILFKMGGEPPIALIVAMLISIINQVPRLYFMKSQLGISPYQYSKAVFGRVLTITFLSFFIIVYVHSFFKEGLFRFIMVLITSFLINVILIWNIGLKQSERNGLKNFIRNKILGHA